MSPKFTFTAYFPGYTVNLKYELPALHLHATPDSRSICDLTCTCENYACCLTHHNGVPLGRRRHASAPVLGDSVDFVRRPWHTLDLLRAKANFPDGIKM